MYRIILQIPSLPLSKAKNRRELAHVPSQRKIKEWARMALYHKKRCGEVTIRLVEKKEIQYLNKTYRFKNKPTNVLSFRADFPKKIKLKVPPLGDIVICSDVVNQEEKKQKKSHAAHWAHIVIHGILHILGYDH